jgi:hypothetical protein
MTLYQSWLVPSDLSIVTSRQVLHHKAAKAQDTLLKGFLELKKHLCEHNVGWIFTQF